VDYPDGSLRHLVSLLPRPCTVKVIELSWYDLKKMKIPLFDVNIYSRAGSYYA
jgi:hypothetical protein